MSKLSSAPLLIHPDTQYALEKLAVSQPHALLLQGESGVGLRTIAEWYVRKATSDSPTVLMPDDKGTIGIDEIRELYKQSRVKRTRHFIIIDDADTMTEPAQNALLKLLEEPSNSVSFLLTSHNNQRLLATISSRLQRVVAKRVEAGATKQIISRASITEPSKIAQILFLADGYPAETVRLIDDDAYFKQKADTMRDARVFLQGDAGEKIRVINEYSNERASALGLLSASMKLIRFSLNSHSSMQSVSQLNMLSRTQERLQYNGHVRTQLLAAIFKT